MLFFPVIESCVLCFCLWRMEQLSQWLWKQEYWLPPGISWVDMEKMEDSRRPLPRDLLLALPLALGFIVLRYAFERWLMTLSSPEGFRCHLTRFDWINNRIWVKLQKVQQYHWMFLHILWAGMWISPLYFLPEYDPLLLLLLLSMIIIIIHTKLCTF